jgi:hypothetical protein
MAEGVPVKFIEVARYEVFFRDRVASGSALGAQLWPCFHAQVNGYQPATGGGGEGSRKSLAAYAARHVQGEIME